VAKARSRARTAKGSAQAQQQKEPAAGKQPRIKWGWLNAGFVVALIGLLGAILPGYLNNPPSPKPDLEMDSVTVEPYHNTHSLAASSAAGGATGITTIDFKVSNTGDQLAVITGLDVKVDSVKYFPPHFTGGLLPVSASYGYTLPLYAGPGHEAMLNEQIAPDQADRFDLNLQLPPNAIKGARYAYRVHFNLLYDNGSSIDAGYQSFVMSAGLSSNTPSVDCDLHRLGWPS